MNLSITFLRTCPVSFLVWFRCPSLAFPQNSAYIRDPCFCYCWLVCPPRLQYMVLKDFASEPLVPSLHWCVSRIQVVKQSKALNSSLLSHFVDLRAGKWQCGILGSKALAAASPHLTSKIVTIGSVARCLRLLSGQWNACVVWTPDPFCVLGLPNLYTVWPAVILRSGVKGFFRLWRDECDVCLLIRPLWGYPGIRQRVNWKLGPWL